MSVRSEFIVHHSGGPADQSVSEIQNWCMDHRGFLDIDYNFLVRGTTGEIYTGRGWMQVGSHTKGHNTPGIGVCVIGMNELSPAAKDSLHWLYAEAMRSAGHPLMIYGHRDLDQTECPGPVVYQWLQTGGIRDLRLTSPRMAGPDVRPVQLKVGVEQDGIYGPLTTAAVTLWQKAHHLVPDGIVGPKTRASFGIH
jgi:peptidoglycan hydrolase-like protein with peptidoglycan-binding domain